MPKSPSFLDKAGGIHRARDLAVVGVGASAGGLNACRTLIAGLPSQNEMALIFVQHLEPNHESVLADLLSASTTMTVRQATEGMLVERKNIYVIPPGKYLSVVNGRLHLTPPLARRGARFPIDFLLHSLADQYGARATGIILSGTGSDGTESAKAIRRNGGFIIAQQPSEAEFDGMPRSAIAAGAIDLVLPLARMPDALLKCISVLAEPPEHQESDSSDSLNLKLPEIIDLLRSRTSHDFRLYKPGTLLRRIERRQGLAGSSGNNIGIYLETLKTDPHELELLAGDLLINVTSFFRDPKIFDILAQKIIPEIVRHADNDGPIRVWIAGCSTGEETYSIAILFREAILALRPQTKLQIFASDVDANAVATAREGLYPNTIVTDVSPARLSQFFFEGRSRLQDYPRITWIGDIRGSGRFGRSTVLPPGPRLVPQRADLSASGSTGTRTLCLPLCLAAERNSAAREC